MARVTWLLPVRDAMPHLPEALASIEAQTFRDFEVLAWDNGSQDGSVEVLRAWIPGRLPGLVVVDRPFDLLGSCLRAMVEEAQTELLARFDADDVNEPERLAKQVAHLDTHPELLAVGSWMRALSPEGRVGGVISQPAVSPIAVRWTMIHYNPLYHPTILMRRDGVLAAGNYAEMGMGQDWELWMRLVQRGAMSNLSEPLLRYRLRPDSVSGRRRREWPALNRELVERHGGALFPGVSRERTLAAWSHFSANSSQQRATPPPRAWIEEMARAMARQAGWDEAEVLREPLVRHSLRRARAETLPGRIAQLPLRLASALRRRRP